MGLFDKLFGKKHASDDKQNQAATETLRFKIIRPLTEEQRERIGKSSILLRTGQLYMHYWTDNLVSTDRNDPEWQNKVMFFWKAEEPFPKKSLPPEFETYRVKHFLFAGDTSNLSLQVAQAMPWFGMPGLGEKHVCEMNGEKVTIPELNKLGLIEYVELVELTNDNLEILTNREKYCFLIDERITSFQNGSFYIKGKPIPIDMAYMIGGIHIIKETDLD
jgi:hypothetical protein